MNIPGCLSNVQLEKLISIMPTTEEQTARYALQEQSVEQIVEPRTHASNSVFGDPCGGTPKYLEVKFTCV